MPSGAARSGATTRCTAAGGRSAAAQPRRRPGDSGREQQRRRRSGAGGVGTPPPDRQRRPQQQQQQQPGDASLQQRKNPDLYSLTTPGGSSPSTSSSPSTNLAARPTSLSLPPTRPEVLAPAGGWPQLVAAVENGADAVYFGLSDFNARARASNFEAHELPEVMAYLHDRGAKGYVVLNVLGAHCWGRGWRE